MSAAAERLRKQLEVPATVMGGEASILHIADVRQILNENDRMRATLAATLPSRLPAFRCDACDNGVEVEWNYCAWCGGTADWKPLPNT